MIYNPYKEAVARIPAQGILTFTSVGMYNGVELSNYLGRALYVMSVDGAMHMLSPRSGFHYGKDTSPKLCIKVDARFDSEPVDGILRPMNYIPGRKADVYITKLEELYNAKGRPTAIYLPQANVSVSLLNDPALLRQAHPYLAPPIDARYKFREEIVVNLHDTNIKYMYVKGVAGMSRLPVIHNKSEGEYIDIIRSMDENGKPRAYRLDVTTETDLRCVDCGYEQFGLVMGLSSQMVYDRFHELHDKISEDLYLAKKELERITAELNETKQENSVLKKQVSAIVKKEEEIHEIKSLELKAEIANSEYVKNKERIEADREMIPVQSQRETRKAELDIAIAQSKLATAESDNSAQTWKSTAAIAGAAVTFGVLATKTFSTSAAVGAAAVVSAPAALAVGAVAATAYAASSSRCQEFVKDTVNAVLRRVRDIRESVSSKLSSYTNGVITKTKDVIHSATNLGKSVVNKCIDVTKSACSTAANAVKSVCSSIGSCVSRVVRCFF